MKKHHSTLLLLTLFFTGLFVLWWASYVEVPTSQDLEATQHLVLPQLAKAALGEIRRLSIEYPPRTTPPRVKGRHASSLNAVTTAGKCLNR